MYAYNGDGRSSEIMIHCRQLTTSEEKEKVRFWDKAEEEFDFRGDWGSLNPLSAPQYCLAFEHSFPTLLVPSIS